MTEFDCPWNILGIDETDDKKTIKKAYAVLIKQYKPDENPEKFKEIQEAYQEAVGILNRKAKTISNQSPSDEESYLIVDAIDKELKITKYILQKIKEVTQKNLENRFSMNHWSFINQFKKIDNLDLKKETAQKVFNLVAQIDLDCKQKNVDLLIPMKIIKYMHPIFGWDDQYKSYLNRFTLQQVNFMYSQAKLDEPAFKVGLIGIEGRLKCLFTDLYPSFIIAYIWMFFGEYGSYAFEFVKHVFLIFSVHRFIFEFLFKNSLGKLGNEAYLVKTNGSDVTRLQIIIKHAVINITFFPMYAWVFNRYLNNKIFFLNEYIDYKIWLPLFGLLVFTNIVTLIVTKRFLHEAVSGIKILYKEPEEKPLFEY